MKRQNDSVAGILGTRNCLGHTCGTNIDTEDVEFTSKQPNLTYIDKVFSFNKDTASPILFPLNTGGPFSNFYITELFLDGNSIFPCTLSPNAVFEIDNSFVVVEYFNTRPPGNINASQVTLDGFPVDFVSFANGQYTARIQNVLTRVQKDRCLDRGLPTKAFFLINNAGPWDLRATYVLEGTVNTNGRRCRFRAEISQAPNAPNTPLPPTGLSSFAVRDLSLPCSINGIAPEILFQFSARVNLLNPVLVVNCGAPPMNGAIGSAEANNDSAETTAEGLGFFPPCPPPIISPIFTNSCTVSLVSTVSVEPVVNVQTVRRTLFCINACEGLQPCQGSILAAEIADEIEDCTIGGVDRPDCRCSRHDDIGGTTTCEAGDTTEEFPRHRRNNVAGAAENPGGPLGDVIGVNNRDIGGVTVGAGTCEDCIFGNPPQPCRQCRHRRDTVGGIRNGRHSGPDGDEVAGLADEADRLGGRGGSHRKFRNDVLGTTDRLFIKGLLREIRNELAEDTADLGGAGYGPDGTLAIEDEGVRRGSFNGCGW